VTLDTAIHATGQLVAMIRENHGATAALAEPIIRK
jgi:hypothetical protein